MLKGPFSISNVKLIAGLGNPGPKYEFTRHNLGSLVLGALPKPDNSVKLFKPTAFMNSCGPEISQQLKFYKLDTTNLLIIHDDLDLPFGELRLQLGRSSAGHHGVDSVIESLGTNNFWRLRMGIGPRGATPGDQFVLERWSSVEEKELTQVIQKAVVMVGKWLVTSG